MKPAVVKQPSSWAQFKQLLAKDLRREIRTREMITSMGVYALLVLIVFGAALTQVSASLDVQQMSGGLLWTLFVFTSLMGLNRSFAYEKENGCLEGLLLAPLDRGAIYLAKMVSNLLFTLLVEVVAVPVFWFFFMGGVSASSSLPLALVPLVLGTVGMSGVGTLLSTITANTRGKDVMLAVLFIPLTFPLLYACVSATTAAIVGTPAALDAFVPAVALVAGYDVVMVLLSWVLYDFVVSA